MYEVVWVKFSYLFLITTAPHHDHETVKNFFQLLNAITNNAPTPASYTAVIWTLHC